MPNIPILKALFVPSLPFDGTNVFPFSWGASVHRGESAPKLPGGCYTPQGFALAIDQLLSGVLGSDENLRVFYRPVPTGTSTIEHRLFCRNQSGQALIIHAGDEECRLKPDVDVPALLGPEAGGADIIISADSEVSLIQWPTTRPHPFRLNSSAFSFDASARVDVIAETGRRYSWAGAPLARLSVMLENVPREEVNRPTNWSYSELLWKRKGDEASLSTILGPRAAPVRGAPFHLYPDASGIEFVYGKLDSDRIDAQRRVYGFFDFSFDVLEQDEPQPEIRRMGAAFVEDFSGDLSAWSETVDWQIASGALEVDTTSSWRRIVYEQSFKDLEIEVRPYFLAGPAVSEFVMAGVGIDLGSNRFVGVGMHIENSDGDEQLSIRTWSQGAAGGGQLLATLSRSRPTGSPGPLLRVQFYSDPHTGMVPNEIRIRVWLGGEGPFEGTIAPGFLLPFLVKPIVFYEDDLGVDPGAEARFGAFSAREFLWDSGPNKLRLEELKVD